MLSTYFGIEPKKKYKKTILVLFSASCYFFGALMFLVVHPSISLVHIFNFMPVLTFRILSLENFRFTSKSFNSVPKSDY